MSGPGASGCRPNAPEGAVGGFATFRIVVPGVIWRDEFVMADGSLVLDPTGAPDARPEYVLDQLGVEGE